MVFVLFFIFAGNKSYNCKKGATLGENFLVVITMHYHYFFFIILAVLNNYMYVVKYKEIVF